MVASSLSTVIFQEKEKRVVASSLSTVIFQEKEKRVVASSLSTVIFQEKEKRVVASSLSTVIFQEKEKRVVASSLSTEEYGRARELSSSLLQLSEADFHDIMSSTRVNNNSSLSEQSSVWRGQLAKILGLDDFGPVLANSLFQLFEEYGKVISGDYSGSSCTTLSRNIDSEQCSQTPVLE